MGRSDFPRKGVSVTKRAQRPNKEGWFLGYGSGTKPGKMTHTQRTTFLINC